MLYTKQKKSWGERNGKLTSLELSYLLNKNSEFFLNMKLPYYLFIHFTLVTINVKENYSTKEDLQGQTKYNVLIQILDESYVPLILWN